MAFVRVCDDVRAWIGMMKNILTESSHSADVRDTQQNRRHSCTCASLLVFKMREDKTPFLVAASSQAETNNSTDSMPQTRRAEISISIELFVLEYFRGGSAIDDASPMSCSHAFDTQRKASTLVCVIISPLIDVSFDLICNNPNRSDNDDCMRWRHQDRYLNAPNERDSIEPSYTLIGQSSCAQR